MRVATGAVNGRYLHLYNPVDNRCSKSKVTNAASRVAETIEAARQAGALVRRKPTETYENSFAENPEKSVYLKDHLRGEVPG